MGQLAGLILRYGVIMGNAIYKVAKKGIDLFKPKLKPKKLTKEELARKHRSKRTDFKSKMTDKELGEKFGQGEVDARKGKKLFEEAWANRKKAKNKKAISKVSQQKSSKQFRKSVQDLPASEQYKGSRDQVLKHLMNTPVAATALAGTTASLVHKNKSKKKGN